MALRDVFKRRRGGDGSAAQAQSLAPRQGADAAPLAPLWSRYDALELTDLAAAARQDAADAAAKRSPDAGALAPARRVPAAPAGPRRTHFNAAPRPGPGLGPISDARSLAHPVAAICEIEAHFDGARQSGVGCRVGRNLILTAAHLVLRPDLGEARSLSLYFHNGADQPLKPIGFRAPPEWRSRVASGSAPRAQDDFAAIIVDAPYEDHSEPYPYLPLHAVRQSWFAKRPAARYRLVGAPREGDAEGIEPHRLYEASGFVLPHLTPRLATILDESGGDGAKRRFMRTGLRHRIRAPGGFSGAPLLTALHDKETNRVYEAGVGLHLGSVDDDPAPFGVARIIDEEVKRRLLLWSREARKLVSSPS